MPKRQRPEAALAEHVLAILNDPHAPVALVNGLHDTLLEISDWLVWTQRPAVLRAVLAEAMRRPPEPPPDLTKVRARKLRAVQAQPPEAQEAETDGGSAASRRRNHAKTDAG